MASLTLKLEDRVLQEYGAGPKVTIGRLRDNTIVIDSPAASSHHASVFAEGDDFVLEDLQSTNGTFVNDRRVSRCTLRHGDIIAVADHKLVFSQQATASVAGHQDGRVASSQGETMFLDPQEHQRLLNIIMNAEARGSMTPSAAPMAGTGVLRVLAGRADREEYTLENHTSVIGRAPWSLIRLTGWFKPRVAVAVTRNQNGYVATRLRGKLVVNDRAINGRYDLEDGDVVCVGGLQLEFRLAASSPVEAAASGNPAVPAGIDREPVASAPHAGAAD